MRQKDYLVNRKMKSEKCSLNICSSRSLFSQIHVIAYSRLKVMFHKKRITRLREVLK